MEKEGFGEEFSICSSFCFGEIRGGQKIQKSNIVPRSFYHFCVHDLKESILGIRLGHFR
jgi:hypothetical protein